MDIRESEESEQVIESNRDFIHGIARGFEKAVDHGVSNINNQMNKITKGGKSSRSLDQFTEEIYKTQQSVLFMLLIQEILTLLVILIYKLIQLVHIFDRVAYIILSISLILYILCLAIVQFGGDLVHKNPQNIYLFISCSILRICWQSYLVVLIDFLKIDIMITVFFIDLILIIIFFQFDKNGTTTNCFLIKDHPIRLLLIFCIELLCLGFIFQFDDLYATMTWILIVVFEYCYCLLQLQMVQIRPYLFKHHNAWYLSVALFDGDLVFPCELLSYFCCSHQDNEQQI